MDSLKKVAVLGGGSFGTVLANLAASNGNQVSLWVRDADQALRINSEGANTSYHPELRLSNNIKASDNLEEVMHEASIIFIATPSLIFDQIIKRISNFLIEEAFIISCTKGILDKPFRTLSDILSDELKNKVGVLSGPNLAKEIADKKIAGTVIASSDDEVIATMLKEYYHLNISKFIQAMIFKELSLLALLKNIYAIICGMAESLKVGENALGLILTRSMAEMSRFAVAKGANPITFLGLAGMGDLVATCTSKLSRNYQLGFNLGQDMSLDNAKKEVGQVAEGLRTLSVIKNESESSR